MNGHEAWTWTGDSDKGHALLDLEIKEGVALHESIDIAMQQNQLSQAILQLYRLLENVPNSVWSYYKLGLCQLVLKEVYSSPFRCAK